MTVKGFKRKFKEMKIISEEEVEYIHSSTIDILKEIGVKFDSKWAIKFFKANDCLVDNNNIVRFPEGLVEECIRRSPENFRVKAFKEKNDMVFNRDTVYFQDAPGMNILDFNKKATRSPTKEEYIEYIKVLDSLPTVHGISCYPYFGAKDIPPVMAIPELMAIKYKYTDKFHQCCYSNDSEIFCIKMAKALGTETLGCIASAPPLSWDNSAVNQARRFVDAGFALGPVSGSNYGGTAPATIAGGIAKTNAEIISMLVLIQLLKPGHRCIMWRLDFPLNMRTGAPGFGQIGASLGNAIFNQMWRYYRIPTGNSTVGFINAKLPDFQSGYEKALGAIISALSGGNLLQLHGGVMGELSAHPVQAVLDEDIAGMVGKFISGVEVNEETIAFDLIKKVGPVPGHYLSTEHTRKWWKIAQFIPKSADRTSNYKEWESRGKKIAIDLAKERVTEILNSYNKKILNEEQIVKIDNILKEARQYYKEKDML